MHISDRIYGRYSIDSPILLELIHSPPLLRLKNISQMGPPDPYYHIPNYSRFEHSVGVMLLLKQLGASEAEQIAGLLHDVSHTAFSHVIDWVIGTGHIEDFQDNQHETFVKKTKIPTILKKYGYSVETIVNYKHFSLLERDVPSLCADRIDYAFREFPIQSAQLCFSHLVAFQNRIAFDDEKIAYIFAHEFLSRQINHWGGYEAVTRYNLFSHMLQKALTLKIITMRDFQKTEKIIMKALERSDDSEISATLRLMKNNDLSHMPKNASFTHKKFRYVDPDVVINHRLVLLSTINTDFKDEIEHARKENEKGVQGGKI